MAAVELKQPSPRFSAECDRAWSQSFLSGIPSPQRERLKISAREYSLPARYMLRAESTDSVPTSSIFLIVKGKLRVFQSSANGRELTFRQVGGVAVVGLSSAISGHAPSAVETVTRARVLQLDGSLYRYLARSNPAIAWITAREISRILFGIQDRLAYSVFEPVWHRMARYLLDVAESDGGRLVVNSSNQAIADAIGTVREVVGRVLNEMCLDRLAERRGNEILLLDSQRLQALTHSARWSEESYPIASRAYDLRDGQDLF